MFSEKTISYIFTKKNKTIFAKPLSPVTSNVVQDLVQN